MVPATLAGSATLHDRLSDAHLLRLHHHQAAFLADRPITATSSTDVYCCHVVPHRAQAADIDRRRAQLIDDELAGGENSDHCSGDASIANGRRLAVYG